MSNRSYESRSDGIVVPAFGGIAQSQPLSSLARLGDRRAVFVPPLTWWAIFCAPQEHGADTETISAAIEGPKNVPQTTSVMRNPPRTAANPQEQLTTEHACVAGLAQPPALCSTCVRDGVLCESRRTLRFRGASKPQGPSATRAKIGRASVGMTASLWYTAIWVCPG
jgi:hypothetical protein